jgi:hypothetical protein
MRKPVVFALAALALLAGAAVLLWPRIAEWNRVRAAQGELLEQPVYRVLREHEPEAFGRMARKYAELEAGGITPAGFSNFSSAVLAEVATRRMAHASDEAVLALMRDMVVTGRRLEAQPGDACFRFLFPEVSGPPDLANVPDQAAQARTHQVIADVIRTSAETPQALPDPAAVSDSLTAVVNATYEQFGADAQMIANAADPRVDRAKVCTITLALYDRILSRPPADASALLRAMTQMN